MVSNANLLEAGAGGRCYNETLTPVFFPETGSQVNETPGILVQHGTVSEQAMSHMVGPQAYRHVGIVRIDSYLIVLNVDK